MNGYDITVAIPTIPPRTIFLLRAMASVSQQVLPPAAVSVAMDVHREGAPATRQRALDAVRTPWVAFLDDDDEFLPQHLSHLLQHALDTGADYVYSWFIPVGMKDPFPETHFTEPFDPENPIETTITTLVRTELAQEVGFQRHPRGGWNTGEDFFFLENILKAGGKVSHLTEKTWRYHLHGRNTSGMPDRW